MNPLLEDEITAPRQPVFWSALRTALGRTPIWFLCWLVPLLLSLVLAVPWRSWYRDALAHHYEPGSVMGYMDEGFRFDHAPELDALKKGSAGVAAALAFLVMMFGVFAGGGWLQVFLERTQGHSLRRFLWGGARYFWRFARVWLLSLVALVVLSWLMYAWPWKMLMKLFFGAHDGDLEVLASESSAVMVTWFQDGIFAVLFALLLTWGDYTRTRLALLDTRSALWAGLCTFGLILLHPVRTLRPIVALFLFEAAIVFGLGSLSRDVNRGLDAQSGAQTLLLVFLLGQIALLWRSIARGARYHAAAQVSRSLVPPLLQPDPWASRVGGPGGPQYPIDLTDDYGVSV